MAAGWHRTGPGVVGAVVVLAAMGCNGENATCDAGTVRVGDRCLALEKGRPRDSNETARLMIEQIINANPSPGQLTTECVFKGVAARRYDIYRCDSVYLGRRIVLRLIRDRRGPEYRFELLSRPIPGVFTAKRGVCDSRVAKFCT